jgi:hypothetical protein
MTVRKHRPEHEEVSGQKRESVKENMKKVKKCEMSFQTDFEEEKR